MNFANWRTSVFGGIATLAAFLTQFPEALSFLDPDTAKKAAAVAAMISGLIAFSQAKDRQVTGNGTVNAPMKVAQSDGTNKVLPVLLVLVLPVLLMGCVTSTTTAPDGTVTKTRRPDAKTMRVIGGVVSDIGAAAAKAAIDQFAEEQRLQGAPGDRGANGPKAAPAPKDVRRPVRTIDFRTERIVDPPLEEIPVMEPLIVTRWPGGVEL